MLLDSSGISDGLLALPPPRSAGFSSVEPPGLGLPGDEPETRFTTGALAMVFPHEARAFNESVSARSKSRLGSRLSYCADSAYGSIVAERGMLKSLLASQRTACGMAM